MSPKVFCFLTIVALSSAYQFNVNDPFGGRSVHYMNGGEDGEYTFNYDIYDPFGANNGRWESGDNLGGKRGGYTITDTDGRTRRVEYIADEHGFRAVVYSNEPGVMPGPAADVSYITDGSALSAASGLLASKAFPPQQKGPRHQAQSVQSGSAFLSKGASIPVRTTVQSPLDADSAKSLTRPARLGELHPSLVKASNPNASFIPSSESETDGKLDMPTITSATAPVVSIRDFVSGLQPFHSYGFVHRSPIRRIWNFFR